MRENSINFKKALCLGIMPIIFLSLSACNKKIRYRVGFSASGSFSRYSTSDINENGNIRVLDSVEEINNFFDKQAVNDNEKLSKKIDEYKENFFIKKSLIIFSAAKADPPGTTEILGIEKAKGTVTINILSISRTGPTLTMLLPWSTWFWLIEVRKADIADAEIKLDVTHIDGGSSRSPYMKHTVLI